MSVSNITLLSPSAYAIPNQQITNEESKKAKAYLTALAEKAGEKDSGISAAQRAEDLTQTGKTRYAEARAKRVLEITGKMAAARAPFRGKSLGTTETREGESEQSRDLMLSDPARFQEPLPAGIRETEGWRGYNGELLQLGDGEGAWIVGDFGIGKSFLAIYIGKNDPKWKVVSPGATEMKIWETASGPVLLGKRSTDDNRIYSRLVGIWRPELSKAETVKVRWVIALDDTYSEFLSAQDLGVRVIDASDLDPTRDQKAILDRVNRFVLADLEMSNKTRKKSPSLSGKPSVTAGKSLGSTNQEWRMLIGAEVDEIREDLREIRGRFIEPKGDPLYSTTIPGMSEYDAAFEGDFKDISELLSEMGAHEAGSIFASYQDIAAALFESADPARETALTKKAVQKYVNEINALLLEVDLTLETLPTEGYVRGASLGDAREMVAVSLPGDDTKYYSITPHMVLNGERERLGQKSIVALAGRDAALKKLESFYKANPTIKFYAPQTIDVPDVSAFFPALEMIYIWSQDHELRFQKDETYRFVFARDIQWPHFNRDHLTAYLPVFKGRVPSEKWYGQTVAAYVRIVNGEAPFGNPRMLGEEQSLFMSFAVVEIQDALDLIQERRLESRLDPSRSITSPEWLEHGDSMARNFSIISGLLASIGVPDEAGFSEDYQEIWAAFFNGAGFANAKSITDQAFQDYVTECSTLLDEARFTYERVSGASLGAEDDFNERYRNRYPDRLSLIAKPMDYRRVYDAMTAIFGIDEARAEEREEKGKKLLEFVYSLPPSEKEDLLKKIIDHLDTYTFSASGAERYMFICLAILNSLKGRDLFSPEALRDAEVLAELGGADGQFISEELDKFRKENLLYSEPPPGMDKIAHFPRALALPFKTSGTLRYLDVGAAFKSGGAAGLNIGKAILAGRPTEFIGTDIFFPRFRIENNLITEIQPGETVTDGRGNSYRDASKDRSADVMSSEFDLGKFDFISILATLHHLKGPNDPFELLSIADFSKSFPELQKYRIVLARESADEVGMVELSERYYITKSQQLVITRLLRSLRDRGVLFLNFAPFWPNKEKLMLNAEEFAKINGQHEGSRSNNHTIIAIQRDDDNRRFIVYKNVLSYHLVQSEDFLLNGNIKKEHLTGGRPINIVSLYPELLVSGDFQKNTNYQKLAELFGKADRLVYAYQELNKSRMGSLAQAKAELARQASLPPSERTGIEPVLRVYLQNVSDTEPLKGALIRDAQKIHRDIMLGASLGASGVFGEGEFQPEHSLVKAGRIVAAENYQSIHGTDLVGYLRALQNTHGVKRVYFDLDLTVFRSKGYLSSSEWFKNVVREFGLEQTLWWWGNAGHEARQVENGFSYRLMDTDIPKIIGELQAEGFEVVGLTARDFDKDQYRTGEILKKFGISLDQIIFASGSSKKGEELDKYEMARDGRTGQTPSLFIEDSFGNLESVLTAREHLFGLYYKPPTANEEDGWDYLVYKEKAQQALAAGESAQAFEYFFNAVVKILELQGITRGTAYTELESIYRRLLALKEAKPAGYEKLLQIVEIAKDGRSYLFHDDKSRALRAAVDAKKFGGASLGTEQRIRGILKEAAAREKRYVHGDLGAVLNVNLLWTQLADREERRELARQITAVRDASLLSLPKFLSESFTASVLTNDPDQMFIYVDRNGNIQGEMWINFDKSDARAQLINLGVAANERYQPETGKGFGKGTFLMDVFFEEARRRGADKFLIISENWTPTGDSATFYKRYFERLGMQEGQEYNAFKIGQWDEAGIFSGAVPSSQRIAQSKSVQAAANSLGGEEESAQVRAALDNLTKPVHLFMSYSDYLKLSDFQMKELYGLSALNPKNLKVTIYGAKSWETIKDTRIEFVTQKPQEIVSGIKADTNNLHLSKLDKEVLADFAPARSDISFFRYQNDERGLLSAALLLSQAEDREVYAVRYGFERKGGFFVAVSEFLQSLIQEYHSRQTVAIAA